MKKSIVFAALALTLVFILASCSQTDVVGSKSITSFSAVLTASPDIVTPDELNGGWSLGAPDGSARFI